MGNARVVKVMFGLCMLLLVPTTAYALQEQIVTSVMKHAPALGATAAPPAAGALLLLALVVSCMQPNLASLHDAPVMQLIADATDDCLDWARRVSCCITGSTS